MHRLQARGRAPLTRPVRNVADVRVGSTTDALAPISVAERSLAAGALQWAALVLVAAAAAAGDQVTKRLVRNQLGLGEEAAVLGPLSIRHVENPGIAFGLFPNATSVVIFLPALAVAWMLVFFPRGGARRPVLLVGLGLVVGGSLSNLVARVRLGPVTAFLDIAFWPAFTLADTFIVVGVAVVLGALLAAARAPGRRRAATGND